MHDVASKLVVEGAEREHDDTTIARAVRHAFGWNTAVPAERIDIIVRRGIVTNARERRPLVPAEGRRGDGDGGTGCRVGGRSDPALGRVRVARGIVTLVGAVGSGRLRDQVETLAGGSVGVRSVVNELRTREVS